jgi:hypothetical protein
MELETWVFSPGACSAGTPPGAESPDPREADTDDQRGAAVSELEIPERARQIACDIYDAALIRDVESEGTEAGGVCAEIQAVEAAARIIVADAFRRLADEMNPGHRPPDTATTALVAWRADQHWIRTLRNHADELDPEGSP